MRFKRIKLRSTRRQFLKHGSIGLAGIPFVGGFSSCVTTKNNKNSLESSVPLDPIQKPEKTSSGYSGATPTRPHAFIRDASPEKLNAPVRFACEVAVIGGGISGLASAFLLRDRDTILIEHEKNLGGNAKGEKWQPKFGPAITYGIGSAYIVKPEDSSPLLKTFYEPLGLPTVWKLHDGENYEISGRIFSAIDVSSIAAADKAQMQKLEELIAQVNSGKHPSLKFPDLPPEDGVLTDQALELDRMSFLNFLEKELKEELTPYVRTRVEQYCYSAFGGSAEEISAACGISFMFGDELGICILPGGNAAIANRFYHKIKEQVKIHAGTLVMSVRQNSDGVLITCVGPDEKSYAIQAKVAVFAAQKFVAKRIVQDIPSEQKEAMNMIQYRAYLVANVLVDAPCRNSAYDIYLLGEGKNNFSDPVKAFENQGATDIVLGAVAQGGHPGASVFTLYCAIPHDAGRAMILNEESLAGYQKKFEDQMRKLFPAFGLTVDAPIAEVRIARWGHALCLAKKELLAKGVPQLASRAIGGKIFFCNQDNWVLPAVETCLTTVMREIVEVRKVLDKV